MNIIYIVTVWPEPQTSGASARVLQLIHCFKNAGFNVLVVSSSKMTDKSAPLESLNIRTAQIELNNHSFDDFIQKEAPDMVLFDRFLSEEKFGWRVAQACPLAMRVLDTIDLHTLRDARAQQCKKDEKQLILQNSTSLREMASIFRCDLTLFVGDYELELVEKHFNVPSSLLYYHPLTIEPCMNSDQNAFEDRAGFVAIGSFLHPPNWDAVLQLKQDIWPRIRKKLRHATLNIVGSYAPEKAKVLHNEKEGFIVKGFVEDDFAIMHQSRVHLAPLRFGAGVKSKCVLAFRANTPTIATSIGAEGLLPSDDWAGEICDDREAFVQAAINMYQCEKTFIKAQSQCHKIVSYFQTDKWESRLILKLQALKKNLLESREENFIGKMMLHHQMLSTRYMSKWIESKAHITGSKKAE